MDFPPHSSKASSLPGYKITSWRTKKFCHQLLSSIVRDLMTCKQGTSFNSKCKACLKPSRWSESRPKIQITTQGSLISWSTRSQTPAFSKRKETERPRATSIQPQAASSSRICQKTAIESSISPASTCVRSKEAAPQSSSKSAMKVERSLWMRLPRLPTINATGITTGPEQWECLLACSTPTNSPSSAARLEKSTPWRKRDRTWGASLTFCDRSF